MNTLRALLGLAVVAFGFYAAWLIMPAYLNNYQLQDAMVEEARLGTYNKKPEEQVRETLYKKAVELEIPLRREQILINIKGTEMVISARYKVPVDMPGYPFELNFEPGSKKKLGQ